MNTNNRFDLFIDDDGDIDLNKIQETVNHLIDHRRELRFLLIGRTGVGKSSTINSLFGEEVAAINKFEPQTMSVKEYLHEHNGVKYRIIDTPGLCDDLESEGNDAKYLDEIKKHINDVDCVWFVTELDANRVTSDEKRGIKIISEELGIRLWSRALIILTRADKVEISEYQLYFERRSTLVRQEIEKYAPEYASEIPAVAVTNKRDVLPSGKQWLGELFTQVYVRFSNAGGLLFLESMKDEVGRSLTQPQKKEVRHERHSKKATYQDVKISQPEKRRNNREVNRSSQSKQPRINLDDEQQEKIKQSTIEKVLAGAAAGATTGVKLGSKFGPVGVAIGGTVGAAIGGLVGWLLR
ncbi:MAG: GTPase [Snowella sp.]|nr:GTPase [Snowella sp.]